MKNTDRTVGQSEQTEQLHEPIILGLEREKVRIALMLLIRKRSGHCLVYNRGGLVRLRVLWDKQLTRSQKGQVIHGSLHVVILIYGAICYYTRTVTSTGVRRLLVD